MKHFLSALFLLLSLTLLSGRPKETGYSANSWVRINLLGYQPQGIKIAVWVTKTGENAAKFELIDEKTKAVVYTSSKVSHFGKYGPFNRATRLHFSDFRQPGRYFIRVGEVLSPLVIIGEDVYKHTADFALRYMRQQRSGFNPFLKDSCHTQDGFVLYGEKAGMKDSTFMDASGGWHDASDYLQYSTTSANATYHLLMAYRDFPSVFHDEKQANGLEGANGIPDVLDEAKWGLDWLLKMHPQPDIMFNQIADDRDHIAMRIPSMDHQYGKGYERPLYFINGEPQVRGKFLNNTTGTSSTAAKFSSAFILGSHLFKNQEKKYARLLEKKAESALQYAHKKPGVTQTASVKSPYIYAEDNWVDDMELAYAAMSGYSTRKNKNELLEQAKNYAEKEPVTPWMINDTANHYQWYPFINLGHYELARQLEGSSKGQLISYYRKGIEQVWNRAKENAFLRGVPFIWCSNNLTVSFAIQCYWYKKLTGDSRFEELEQANFDWLFGCNPWGTSMVYGLPSWGDTPQDPHSAFTHLKNYPIDGGLVDGPVYTQIFNSLIGIKLAEEDEYAAFQSDLAVYHDDYGDYSTNEPTMDGTASLVYLLAAFDDKAASPSASARSEQLHGAIIRGNKEEKKIALIFTGDEYADGGAVIYQALQRQKQKASFFFTGNFYRNPTFKNLIGRLKSAGHYLGAHSDQHLLYNSWEKRDSLLVNEETFKKDLRANYNAMNTFGIQSKDAPYFLPPYEWYNHRISEWTKEEGFQLINFSPGTRSNADYTYPEMGNAYRSSDEIYQSILRYEESQPHGLNGFMLLMHIGTDPRRTDKFYDKLPALLDHLKKKGYQLVTINDLLSQ